MSDPQFLTQAELDEVCDMMRGLNTTRKPESIDVKVHVEDVNSDLLGTIKTMNDAGYCFVPLVGVGDA